MPGISIPIIDQLFHPSIGLLARIAVPGNPLAGPVIALAPPNSLIVLTYGVVFKINTVGAKHGRTVGLPVIFDPPLAVATVQYQDHSGFGVTRQVTDVLYDAQDLMWDEPLPALLTVYMQPDVLLDLFWLQT